MKLLQSRGDLVKNGLAVFVVLLVSIIGIKLLTSSHALTGATMTLTSPSTSVTSGSTVAVAIHEDSATDMVNSVQASLGYDPAQLQFVSFTPSTAFPTVAANSTATAGVIRVGRAVQTSPAGTPVTGDNIVVTANFKVLAISGTAAITIDKGFSFVVRSTDNADILGTTTGTSFTVTGTPSAASATMTLAPASGSITSGSTITVAIRENSGSEPVNSVQSSVTYDPVQLQFLSMTEGGSFSNVAATDTATAGRVRVGRSVAGGAGISGDNLIVTLSFKVLSSTGSVNLAVDKVQSFVVTSATNKDILNTISGAGFIVATTAPVAKGSFSLSPASGSFATGSTISVTISASSNSGLSTVEPVLSYPASQLQFIAPVTEGSVFSTVLRTNATTSGVLDIIRSLPGGSAGVVGTNTVVTANFKVIGTSGAAAISVGKGSAIFDDTGSGTNIIDVTNTTGASYTIASAPPSCSAAPSMPGAPLKTAVTYTSVTFSWAASTAAANCSLAGYHILRGAVNVADVTTGTSFSESGLKAGGSYNYSVIAFDTAGHTSVASPVAVMTTRIDDVAPTTPVGLTANALNASSVLLAWNPSTDFPNPGGVGVAGYHIYRGTATVPTYTSATTTFTDFNVAASTTYSYTVRAYDLLGNESAPSSIATARTATPPVGCIGNPTAPTTLTAGSVTMTTVNLSWSPSTAAAACALSGYHIFRDSLPVGTSTTTSFNDSGLAANTNYTYTVVAFDTAAHSSALSPAKVIATAADTSVPTAPLVVTANPVSAGQVTIGWVASTDNVAVTGYKIYRGGTPLKTVAAAARSYVDTTVVGNTDYRYTVSAFDAAANESQQTVANPSPVHTPTALDTQAPSSPANLRTVSSTIDSIVLTWTASTDNIAVAGYHVYRGTKFVGDAFATSYADSGLTANTSYSYTVKAFDAAGNMSVVSAPLSAATIAPITNTIYDLNGDKQIDILDIVTLISRLDAVKTPIEFGDFNQDQIIDIFDITILINHLGEPV